MATPPFGVIIPNGYEFEREGVCASCRAPIVWATTTKGNRAPLDRDGISHFSSCPNAADHRRKPDRP